MNKYNYTTRFLIIVCLTIVTSVSLFAQTTTFEPTDYCISKTDRDVYVSKIEIYTKYICVDITIVPKKDLAHLNYWYSVNTYLMADNKRHKLLGATDAAKKEYHRCTYSDGWGWDKAKAGYAYTFTLVFDGSIDVGVEQCSIIDKGTNPGDNFQNIIIDNSPFGDKDHELYFVYGKAYLAYTNATVSMKEGAGTNYNTVETLKPGTVVVIDTREANGDYYYATNFDTGSEGYISKSKVSPYEIIPESDGSFFQETKISDYNQDPLVEITNNTSKNIKLKLNGTTYKINAYNKIEITIPQGQYNFKATAPGVMPDIGSKTFRVNYKYTWNFYIVTSKY